jgi:hypothetical protein
LINMIFESFKNILKSFNGNINDDGDQGPTIAYWDRIQNDGFLLLLLFSNKSKTKTWFKTGLFINCMDFVVVRTKINKK